MSVFSEKLSELMKIRDMSDDELADLVGVNRTTVTRWRIGERSPKMEKLPEISAVFSVDPRIFVGENEVNDINLIFGHLNEDNKLATYNFAKERLKEQETGKITDFYSTRRVETLAAHSDDPDKKYSPEEIELINRHLDEIDRQHGLKKD